MAKPPTPTRRLPLVWLFFGLRGRISRGLYWLAFLFLQCVQAAIALQILGGPEAGYFQLAASAGLIVLFVTLYANLAVSVKRLHDIGYAGALAIALLIPVVNLAFSIWAGMAPGTAGPNRFGAGPDLLPD